MGIYSVAEEHNLQEVVSIGDVGEAYSYDWSSFEGYYSPDARKYFWYEDSGCSCNAFGDMVNNLSELCNGNKEDLIRAADNWTSMYTRTMPERQTALIQIRDFKP